MAIWKEQTPAKKEPAPMSPDPIRTDARSDLPSSAYDLPRSKPADREPKESLIAAEITIEGKIEGAGHVRIAGRFKGDVHVQGNLTIETGAKLTGGVRANTVIIGGELEGNVDGATRVELLESGVLNGDLKAGSLTVAAGSRMRGQVEFGWDEKGAHKSGAKVESGAAL
ncbi:MAG: polymer-forming cytoskeletal protein [Gemmatimonadales bacterium]|nr:polymer-forming cytoskeletal protein [Gemmatimonadales bacterium]